MAKTDVTRRIDQMVVSIPISNFRPSGGNGSTPGNYLRKSGVDDGATQVRQRFLQGVQALADSLFDGKVGIGVDPAYDLDVLGVVRLAALLIGHGPDDPYVSLQGDTLYISAPAHNVVIKTDKEVHVEGETGANITAHNGPVTLNAIGPNNGMKMVLSDNIVQFGYDDGSGTYVVVSEMDKDGNWT